MPLEMVVAVTDNAYMKQQETWEYQVS